MSLSGKELPITVVQNVHYKQSEIIDCQLLYNTNIDQTIMNSLHRLLNCEIGELDCCVITTEYRTRVHVLVHVIYSGVPGQCSHTI